MTEAQADTSAFTLTAPDAGPAEIDGNEALKQVQQQNPLSSTELAAVEDEAKNLSTYATSLDPLNPRFKEISKEISTWGAKTIEDASNVSSRILDRPAADSQKNSPQMRVAGTLGELRSQITSLDPNRADLTGGKRILRFLPWGNKIDAYFNRYRSAQNHLDAIVRALLSGKDELGKDNADLEVQRSAMWAAMVDIRKIVARLQIVDGTITAEIAKARAAGNETLAKALESDVLFYVRQRHEDLVSNAGVNAQGFLALDAIQKINNELIRGVDRARTTTLNALRIAMIVSGGLATQRLVLSSIQGLEETTNNLVAATARTLNQQTTEMAQQASESGMDLEVLGEAFNETYAALDTIDNFRIEANEARAQRISAFKAQMDKASSHLARSAEASGFEGAATDRQDAEQRGVAFEAPTQIEQGSAAPTGSAAPARPKMPWD